MRDFIEYQQRESGALLKLLHITKIQMLGKIVGEGYQTHIYCPVIKTSNSGLFGNKRLAVLDLKQARIGYLSKVPDSLQTFQDANCINNCKEKLNIKQVNNFTYWIDPTNRTSLTMRWQEDKQKTWEFKFQNQMLSNQWYQYMQFVVHPPPPVVQPAPQPPKPEPPKSTQQQVKQQNTINVDFSQLQKPSRFRVQEQINEQSLSEQSKQKQQRNNDSQRNHFKKSNSLSQSNQINNDSKPTSPYRFQKYQQQNEPEDHSNIQMKMPIITTFREKFPNQAMFNSLGNKQRTNGNDGNVGNWNLRWFQAIETEQEQIRIDIYQQFLNQCKKGCLSIIEQLTVLKKDRTIIPERVTMSQQIYEHKQITFRLSLQRDIDKDHQTLMSDQQYRRYRQQMQNYKYILKATKNKSFIKVPLVCIVEYVGFAFLCEATLPSNYQQVDHSAKYLFQRQINRLEQQLRLRIGLADINLFTNRPNSSPQSKSTRSSYIIIKNIRNLLPQSKGSGADSFFALPKNIFLQSFDIQSVSKDSNFYSQSKGQFIDNFIKNQSISRSIVSSQDLNERLQQCKLSTMLASEIMSKSNNKYLNKILATEIASDILCHIIRSQINIFYKTWSQYLPNLTSNQTPNYQHIIYKIVDQFFSDSSVYNVWKLLGNYAFQKYSLTIKKEQIIIGYLLAAISFKTGIQFDYQLLIHQQSYFFVSETVIPQSSILEFHPIFVKFNLEDLCLSYEHIINHMIQKQCDQYGLDEVVNFFNLKNSKIEMQPYIWAKICKFLSFFIPYQKQEDYKHLQIYSCLSLYYLNFDHYSILVSAVKWLLHDHRQDEAIELINFFQSICWFWVGDINPLIINFYQILAQYYYGVIKNIPQSIKYLSKTLESLDNLYKSGSELINIENHFKLAQMYMLCNRHKQALQKFREVKKNIKKINKESLIVLDIIVLIAKLYLHLGDITKCIKNCKQAIEYSVLNPFNSEEQEFEVYSILLRCFQINDQADKYTFYLDIVEDKFGTTNNCFILLNVLRLTFQAYLQKVKTYFIKKLCFLLYFYQERMSGKTLSAQVQKQQIDVNRQLFKKIKNIEINEKICLYVRKCLKKSAQIIDELVLIQQKQKKYQKLLQIQFVNQAEHLKIICQFVGYQFINGLIISSLQKHQH